MDFTFTPLADIPQASLPGLASLHAATMPTLLTDLGLPFLLRYYQLAQKSPSVIAFIALHPTTEHKAPSIDNDSLITAYCLGSPNPAALNAKLRQPITWFSIQMLKLAFTRPSILIQLTQSILTASNANSLRPGQIELTYIGVALQSRGQGLGLALLQKFAESARTAGYTSIALSVETDNPAAIGLYTKFGFTITQTFTEGRYHRHRMEYSLANRSIP